MNAVLTEKPGTIKARAYRAANRGKVNAYNRQWYANNLEKGRAKSRAWHRNHPQKSQSGKQARLYGLSREQFELLLPQRDNGPCDICGRMRLVNEKRFDTDHTERNGVKKVRGILCHQHNKGLGLFGDSPALLRAAANYLEQHNG